MRILALSRYGRLGASSRLRTFQYKEPFVRHGIVMDVLPLFSDDYIRALYGRASRLTHILSAFSGRLKALTSTRGYDAIWIEKEIFPWLPACVEISLFPENIPVIADYDDAVFHRYDNHYSPIIRMMLGKKLDRVMARADLVVAGNDYLADRARKAGAPRVEIIPTVIDLKRYAIQPRPDRDFLTIGWIGSPNTARYLEIIKPVVSRLANEVPIRALAVGAREDQVAGSIFTARVWTEETETHEMGEFDIGVMPLPDTPWERGKCGYKIIQYMALGLPVVASPVGVNQKIVKSTNGFLAASDGEWLAALRELSGNPELRRSFGSAGRFDVEADYNVDVQAPRLASLIKSVVQ